MADLADFLIWFSVASFLFLGVVGLLEVAINRSVGQLSRRKETLPTRERDLLGDDYRDCVADYFARKQTRQRIVREVARVRSE